MHEPHDEPLNSAGAAPSASRIDDWRIDELAAAEGTPVVAYSAARVRANATSCMETFRSFANVLFSVKACYLAPVLRIIRDCGVGAEVCSEGEFALALAVGFPPERIMWNAVALSEREARTVADAGVHLAVNTIDDIRRVGAVAGAAGRRLELLLRIHPSGIDSAYLKRGSRLGFDVEDGSARRAVDAVLASDALDLVGVTSHTQVRQITADRLCESLRTSLAFVDEVEAVTGTRVRRVGIGGGLHSRAELDAIGASVADFASAFRKVLHDEASDDVRLLFEPGRYLVSDAAIGITTVLSRAVAAGTAWLVIDLGANVLLPFDRSFSFEAVAPRTGPTAPTSIGDRMSSYASVLARDVPLPPVEPGDLLVVVDVGAYTTSTAQRFMYGMPKVVVVDGDAVEVAWLAEDPEGWARHVVECGAALSRPGGS